MSLESLLIGQAANIGGIVADNATTYLALTSDRGSGALETNPGLRALISKYKLTKGLLVAGTGATVRSVVLGCGFYAIDRLLNIDDSPVNFHKFYLFGGAGLRGITSLTNVAVALNYRKTSKVLGYIPRLVNKVLTRINLGKYFMKDRDDEPVVGKARVSGRHRRRR